MAMIRSRFLALLLGGLAAGCGNGGGAGGGDGSSLSIAYIADEGLLVDPESARDRAVIAATQIGLTGNEPGGRVVPALAQRWRVSDDGLTYVFKLRDARWADGRRLTAGDVVAVLRRIIAPGSGNPLRKRLMMVENAAQVASNRKPARMLGIEDPRPDTVVIRLNRAEPALLQILADPAAAIVRSGADPSAAGPYKRAEGDAGAIILTRNAFYYDAAKVTLDSATLSEDDAASAIEALKAGRIDVVTGALVTGLAANVLDFDDNFDPPKAHPTAVLFPAIMAIAEEERRSGAACVDAYIVGLQILGRIGQGLNPAHRNRGWHATATVGVMGATAAVSRLLRLDAETCARALSVATSMSAGFMSQFGTEMKPVHAGLAAKGGIMAARMAQAGIRPIVLAEVDDMAMLRLIARDSGWLTVLPEVVVQDELRTRRLARYCDVPDLSEDFYAITTERRFQPAVLKDLLKRPADEVLAP